MVLGRQVEHAAELRLLFGVQRIVRHRDLVSDRLRDRLIRHGGVLRGHRLVPARQIGHGLGQLPHFVIAQRLRLPVSLGGDVGDRFGSHVILHLGCGRPGRHRGLLAATVGHHRRPRGLLGQRIQRRTRRHRRGPASRIAFFAQRRQR
ncbi:hypothetical protein G6F60_014172 [Rhizopus arrhizus]|nr:hypothetical protein G6F60_014172 [Rhizopus arrhizus]